MKLKSKVSFIASLVGIGGPLAYYKLGKNFSLHAKELGQSKLVLQSVQVVHRHGARPPLVSMECFPDIEYGPRLMDHGDHTFTPHKVVDCEGNDFDATKLRGYSSKFLGQLSAAGAQQLHDLGKLLRHKYVDEQNFLSGYYSPSEVKCWSTKMRRTVESERCLLSGLFPNNDVEIPIHVTADGASEFLSPNYRSCQYLKVISAMTWDNPDKIQGVKEARTQLQEMLGIPESDKSFHIVLARDWLFNNKFHGVLPSQYDNEKILELAELGALSVMESWGGKNKKNYKGLRLSIGRLIKTILDTFNEADCEKLKLYSGHDTTLIPLLCAMDVYDGRWPPFAAHVIFELYKHKEEPDRKFVRILYNDVEQLIPGCCFACVDDKLVCDVSEFGDVMRGYAIADDDYERECADVC